MVEMNLREEPGNRNERITCNLCRLACATVEDAVEEGWISSYYDHNDHETGPACPRCCERYLVYDTASATYELAGRWN